MQHHGLRYPSLSDPGDRIAAEVNRIIPVTDFPSTLAASPDARIAGRVIGAASDHDLRRLIKAALSSPATWRVASLRSACSRQEAQELLVA